ncbi:MAG: hypothetical protein NT084_10395 [Bacteroidetes bacterium]|nr:hypothetical protein [Bacteroidota bacterium]
MRSQYSYFLLGLSIALLFPCFKAFGNKIETSTRESWMDSAIAEGVRKIEASEIVRKTNYHPSEWENLNHFNYGSSYIVIDLAKWTPTLTTGQFYYEKANSPQFSAMGNGTYHIWDSLNSYNLKYENRADFVSYYNIVLKNFPLELRKDISTVKTDEGSNLFTQLQQLGAIKLEDYGESLNKFATIIDNISILAQTNFQIGKIVCFGTANILGQFGKTPDMRASFAAYYVKQDGFANALPWLNDLVKIPKYMCPPIPSLNPPSVPEKNFQIALAVEHYITCNQYGDCNMSSDVFSNQYAKWLFDNLKTAGNISPSLLLNTCTKLNSLSNEMSWAVLTADYENDFASYVNNPLGSLYTFYTDATLNNISLYTNQIVRGKDYLSNKAVLNRDSVLYYGRFLYRIPSFVSTIGTTQRVKLLKNIALSSCNDIMGVTEASNYENHCERICKSLYQNLPDGEERNFLDQLKSTGAIWDLSYRLDNATFGFFGADNYTDFIFTISNYWKKAYPEKSHPSSMSGVNFFVYKWDDAFFNSNAWITANVPSNSISATVLVRHGFSILNFFTSPTVSDIYDPVMIHASNGSLIPDNPGVKDMVVPAIFLDWLSHKKTLDDIGTATKVSLAALSLATGIGEIYEATSLTIKTISVLQVAVSASDLILLNDNVKNSIIGLFPSHQEGQEFIDAYMNISMAVNIATIGKSLLTNWNNDVHVFTNQFDSEEQALKSMLGESSADFQGMKKLRGELGVAEEVVESIGHTMNFQPSWLPNRVITGNLNTPKGVLGVFQKQMPNGNWIKDTKNALDDINFPQATANNFKTISKDGFKLLNTPGEFYVDADQFWNQYNKPWLDELIGQKSEIVILSDKSDDLLKYQWDIDPITNTPIFRKIPNTNTRIQTGFGREIEYMENLVQQGKYEWDGINGIYKNIQH